MTITKATRDWVGIACLIIDAGDALREAHAGGRHDHLVFRVEQLGAQALSMLPVGRFEVQLAYHEEPFSRDQSPLRLLLDAEELTRAHPIEAFPAGASVVVVGLIDALHDLLAGC